MSPVDYLAAYGAPGCLEAWAHAVWDAFLASGIVFTHAQLIWKDVTMGGLQWMAHEVYPNEAGGYHGVIDLSTKITVVYC